MVKEFTLVELMSRITRKIRRLMVPITEAEGISFTETMVLWKINRMRRCRVTDISGDMSISPSTLTGVTDRLVARGLLLRVTDPADRRAILLEVSPEVPELIEKMKQAGTRELARALQPIPRERLEGLTEDLRLVLECLEHGEERSRGNEGE